MKAIPKTEVTGVTLELSVKEARFIASVMNKIGGSAQETDRYIADDIRRELDRIGVGPAAIFSGSLTALLDRRLH